MQEDSHLQSKDEAAQKGAPSSPQKSSDTTHAKHPATCATVMKPYPESVWHLRPTFQDFEDIEKDPHSVFPYKLIVFPGNHSDLVGKIVRPRGFTKATGKDEDPIDDIDFIWRPVNFSPKFYLRIDRANCGRDPKAQIVINHLENINGICTKTGLIKSLRRFYKSEPEPIASNYTVHESVPSTFVVLPDYHDAEYQAFVKHFHDLEKHVFKREKVPAKHCADNLWLIKPAALNQGRGIEIFRNDLNGMKKFLDSRPPNSYWVIQKYIERPLLYKGRKFDIRMWAVMTWKSELYYYKHGYIRTSSDMYTLDSKLNYVHLTNNCLQQFGDKYGSFEEGNTLEFAVFKEYLKQTFPQLKLDFDTHIMGRIKDLMIDSFLSVKDELNPSKRRNCFELLGFDFLIDEDFRVWLIEVNTNPYLGLPNKFIEGLLPKMLNDLCELVIDPYIKPANSLPKREVENQFVLLYDDKKKINLRRSYSESVYPLAELMPPPVVPAAKAPAVKREGRSPAEPSPKKTRPKKSDPTSNDKQHAESKEAKSPDAGSKPEKKEKYKIPPAPAVPKRKLLDEVKVLVENDNAEQFALYTRRIAGCFGNLDLLPEQDIDDALNSITIILNSKIKSRLYLSSLFGVLTKMAVDFKKDMPAKVRKSLIDIIVKVSHDTQYRKYLMQMETVHGLIQIALNSCNGNKSPPSATEQNNSLVEEQVYAKEAVVVLYNLAGFNRPKFYIPGETVRQAKDRRRFILWGGLLCLHYLVDRTKIKEISEFLEATKLKELELRDLEDLVKVMKLQLESVDEGKDKASRNESVTSTMQKVTEEDNKADAEPVPDEANPARSASLDSSLPQDVCFPEAVKMLNIPELLASLEDELKMRKEEFNKKQTEMQQLRATQREGEMKKREEEERTKREKKEQAFQEYIRRVEQRKKERVEQQKREQEEKETRLKEEEAKKKTLIEMLKKKEEDRRMKKFQEMKKKAEIEKKEAEVLEKRAKEHMERQQKALEEWHRRKIESAKKVRASVTDKYFTNPKKEGALNSIYIFNSTTRLNSSVDESADAHKRTVKMRRTSEERKKLRSLRLKKGGKDFKEDDGFESDTKNEARGQYIKRLLHTLSQKAIQEESDSPAKKKPAKKAKKELFTEMDYKIMSIYKAPLPTSKPFFKKKKNSFNLYMLNE